MGTAEEATPATNPPAKSSIFDIVNAKIRTNRLTQRVRSKLESSRNMHYIKELSRTKLLSKTDQYEPKVSERFLEEWLDFPRHQQHFVLFNTIYLLTRWLLWTNKSIASLDPSNPSIRDRLSNTIAQLSMASGLFLVMAVACFTFPPEPRYGSPELQRILLDIYGVLLFTSMTCSLFYIGYALTALYPVLQSIRDDIAFDGYEHLKRGLGGYELYMFNVALQALAASFYIAAYLVYSFYAFVAMVIVSVFLYGLVLALTRDMFISLDPISAMHLGLSNCPLVMRRAELMAQYILRQVPNHLLDEVREENRASLDLAAHRHIRDHLQRLQSELSTDPLENSLPQEGGPQVFNSDKYNNDGHVAAFSPTSVVRPASTTTAADNVHTTATERNSATSLLSRKNQIHPDVPRGVIGGAGLHRVDTNQRLRDATRKVIHHDDVEAHKTRYHDGLETQIVEHTPNVN